MKAVEANPVSRKGAVDEFAPFAMRAPGITKDDRVELILEGDDVGVRSYMHVLIAILGRLGPIKVRTTK